MCMARSARWLSRAVAVVYGLVMFEVMIMVSPFAVTCMLLTGRLSDVFNQLRQPKAASRKLEYPLFCS